MTVTHVNNILTLNKNVIKYDLMGWLFDLMVIKVTEDFILKIKMNSNPPPFCSEGSYDEMDN